jgi:6-pyruvoyl-tetrahydropterin synthase
MRLMVKHNMEMAHRLSQDTTKCKQIHGHSMQVTLVFLNLREGDNGMAVNNLNEVVELGAAKRRFRDHIDSVYDHHLVLNETDPFAGNLYFHGEDWEDNNPAGEPTNGGQAFLPGLTTSPGEPTVENLAKWIGEWGASTFRCDVVCHIDETRTNGAEVMVCWTGMGTKVKL